MFGANKGKADRLAGTDLRIGVVQARFNEDITNTLAREGGIERAATPGRGQRRHHAGEGARSLERLWPCRPWPKRLF